jgi:hypothetical protein
VNRAARVWSVAPGPYPLEGGDGMTQVTMRDVMRWLRAAFDAAREDPGDEGDTVTALSYRRLEFTLAASPGQVRVEVVTWNRGFSGWKRREYARTTDDGVEVRWNSDDQGIPTGADWLPEGFISWMKGGESR